MLPPDRKDLTDRVTSTLDFEEEVNILEFETHL